MYFYSLQQILWGKCFLFRLSCIEDSFCCEFGCILSGILVPWKRTGFRVISENNLKAQLENYVKKYIKVKKSQYKVGVGYNGTQTKFKTSLEGNRNEEVLKMEKVEHIS